MVDILIKNGLVLTMDRERRIIREGAIAIEKNKIVDVGKSSDLVKSVRADKVIDASGRIVMPGLVCTHCHTHSKVWMGIPTPPATELYSILSTGWWPMLEDQLTKKDVYNIARFACLEMITLGTTMVCDVMEAPKGLPGILDSEANGFREVGMRGIVCQEATERISKENGELGIRENADFAKKWNKDPNALVKGMLCVHTTFTCSLEMLKRVRRLADELRCGITLHVEESVYEVDYCKKTYGKPSVPLLNEIGFLGPDVLAAQCVQTTEEEIKTLAKRGVKVAHNLQTNMETGGGIPRVPQMLDAGLTVSVGNDGFIPDMFEVIRGVFMTHKGVTRDVNVLPADKCMDMVTIEGAKALGMEREIGSLEKGKKADLIIMRFPTVTPLIPDSVYYQIMTLARGETVETSIIDGRIVMENRKVLTADPEEVMKNCAETSLDIWNRDKVDLEKRLL